MGLAWHQGCSIVNKMNKTIKFCLVALALAGCAHEPPFAPSQGHIDSTQQTKPVAAPGNIPKPVKNNAFLPPPKPKVKEQTYSVVVNDVPVREILFALARESKLNIDISPEVQGSVTMNAVDQSLPAILERLSKQIDMIYKIEDGVLSVTQDKPVLRTYQINYVNMDRDTKGSIGVSQQIASAGAAGSGGPQTGAASVSVGGGSNTSMTTVDSISKNHFWDTLIQNIRDILAESDKAVLVSRMQTDSRMQASYDAQNNVSASGTGNATVGGKVGVAGSGDQNIQGSTFGNAEQAKQNKREEYKMLYAAAIIANRETGVLSIRATQRQHESIQEFIDKVQSSAKRQVLIEATIVEITLNDKFQAGIDWSRLGSDGTLKGFTFKQDLLGTALTAAPRFVVGYNNTRSPLGDLAASIRMLENFGNTKVLSSPKMMVLNSQTAVLKVVDNLVYFTVDASTTSNQTNSTVTFTTTPHTLPVGVWMSVTPQINENGAVTLNVRPTISRVSGSVVDPNPNIKIESKIPTVQVREMESVLQINSGNTVVLGGLMQDEVTRSNNNVPVASKIPLFGKLFQSKDDSTKKTELVIFLRPTVISNASLESEELKAFKQYLPDQLPVTAIDESAH